MIFFFILFFDIIVISSILYFKSYPKKSFHKKNLINIFISYFLSWGFIIFSILLIQNYINCADLADLLDELNGLTFFALNFMINFLPFFFLYTTILFCKKVINNSIEKND